VTDLDDTTRLGSSPSYLGIGCRDTWASQEHGS
jgi:hypothetical protein